MHQDIKLAQLSLNQFLQAFINDPSHANLEAIDAQLREYKTLHSLYYGRFFRIKKREYGIHLTENVEYLAPGP